MSHPMNIGQAAQAAGVSAKMIRNYEELGLIPEALRTESGYRQYTARDIATLRFIKESRTLGFSTRQIAQLLGLWADAHRESREVKQVASEHIAELDRRMAELARMKSALERVVSGCQGDHRADCPILSRLSADAAPTPAAPRASAETKRRSPASTPAATTDPAGLTAWMQGLDRIAVSEYA